MYLMPKRSPKHKPKKRRGPITYKNIAIFFYNYFIYFYVNDYILFINYYILVSIFYSFDL